MPVPVLQSGLDCVDVLVAEGRYTWPIAICGNWARTHFGSDCWLMGHVWFVIWNTELVSVGVFIFENNGVSNGKL